VESILLSMPCTNVNHEVMMQYHDWDITIILTLEDTFAIPHRITFVSRQCSFCHFCYRKSICTFVCCWMHWCILSENTCQNSCGDLHTNSLNCKLFTILGSIPTLSKPFFLLLELFDAIFCFLSFYIHVHNNSVPTLACQCIYLSHVLLLMG